MHERPIFSDVLDVQNELESGAKNGPRKEMTVNVEIRVISHGWLAGVASEKIAGFMLRQSVLPRFKQQSKSVCP